MKLQELQNKEGNNLNTHIIDDVKCGVCWKKILILIVNEMSVANVNKSYCFVESR